MTRRIPWKDRPWPTWAGPSTHTVKECYHYGCAVCVRYPHSRRDCPMPLDCDYHTKDGES